MNGLPTVAVHDLRIHESGDLIAGTHGRGVWILDDITPLRQMSAEVAEKPVFLFENPVATLWHGVSRGATRGHQLFLGRNPLSMSQSEPSNSPTDIRNSATVNFYLQSDPDVKPEIKISNLTGDRMFRARIEASAGINRYRWNWMYSQTGAAEPTQATGRLERAVGLLRSGNAGPAQLEPGSYLAVVERSPEVVLGTSAAREEAGFHLVQGTW